MLRCLVLLAGICAMPLCAATLTVTNLNDTGADSLRELATTAAAGDEIVFDTSLTGSINFAGTIPINVPLTITGPVDADGKPTLTLDGGGASKFFTANNHFTLNNLRLFDGLVGTSNGVVAMSVAFNLVVHNCVFDSNVAGAGSAPVRALGASVWLSDCTFTGNVSAGGGGAAGGLLAQNANTTIRRCTFANNSSSEAGAILFLGASTPGQFSMLVEDSTFSANSSSGGLLPGGAIVVGTSPLGGFAQSVVASRCTFSENQSATSTCVSVVCNHSTNFAQFAARDCIFTDSVAGPTFSGFGSAAFASLGNNICSDAPAWMTTGGDQVNTNPLLLALADNGGLTPTHAIDTTSPAYNAGGPNAGLSNDQRGRLRDDKPDIGAFELQAADLRVAEGANAITSGSTLLSTSVVLPGAAQPRTFTLTNAATAEQDLAVTVPVTISGAVNCTATATTQPGATLTPGTSSDLIVEATPTATGFFQYTVTITSNDPDTPSFTFTVASYAQTPGNGGGGGDDNDSGCSTGASSSLAWLALLGVIAVLGVRLQRAD